MAKILIIEDENIIAEDLKITLTSFGYDVEDVIASGEEAILKTEELKPDLVLMDIKLDGEINGIEAASKIHKKSNVPIIFCTAYTDDKTYKKALITKPSGYIVKPFNESELHDTIQQTFKKLNIN